MAANTAEGILKQLDTLLAQNEWKGPPSDLSHLSDPAHLENFQRLANYEQTISNWMAKKMSQLIEAKSTSALRICSIGCGDGTFDTLLLEEISINHPDLSIHYVGINADEQMHELAEEKMHSIGGRITVELLTEDYHELSKETCAPFDIVLMVNPQFSCIYEESEVRPLMETVLQLLKPKGEMIVISSSRQSFNELIARFWKHQRRHDLCTTEFLVSALRKMGVEFTMQQEPLTFNLSDCFKDNFKSLSAMQILDHLVLVRLEDYDPAAAQLCMEYLVSLKQGQGLVESLCDMIVIRT